MKRDLRKYRFWLASQSSLSSGEKIMLVKQFGNEEHIFKASDL